MTKKFIGVMKFDTITTLEEFLQICHDLLKRKFELYLELEKELDNKKLIPKDIDVQIIITKGD